MPEISRFFGIVVRINDHEPAHFHVSYGEFEALIEVETLAIYRGELPRRALALTLEWAALHREELRHDWKLAKAWQLPKPIAPLERKGRRHGVSKNSTGNPTRKLEIAAHAY